MSGAGNPDLSTPAMDSLASDGVRFENAYCTFPLCTPARASMFTGLMPGKLGVTGNEAELPVEEVDLELGGLMRRAGYECVQLGKWHVPEIAMPDGAHGFRTLAGFDDNAIVPAARDFFAERASTGGADPFFMVASFDNPHNICEWARRQPLPWGEVPDALTEECPSLPANFPIPPYEPEVIRKIIEAMPKVYSSGVTDTPDLWRRHRNAYFRLVEKVDRQVGELLDALRDNGLYDDTLVVFVSDHGDGNGAHRWRQKSFLYQEAVRVPFIVKAPHGSGAASAGRVDDASLVSAGLDLLPTICDYAGVSVPDRAQGDSLRPFIDDAGAVLDREAVFVETSTGADQNTSVQGRLVRTTDYTYIAYSWGENREQLFHPATDPGEMINLAMERRSRRVLERHRAILLEHVRASGDSFATHYSHPGVPTVPGYAFGSER
jgi:arylsulfatase A-like enzyme